MSSREYGQKDRNTFRGTFERAFAGVVFAATTVFIMGGTFAAGGSFSITGNGTGGIPNGVIFNGSFTGPVTWTLITLGNGTHNYTLTGSLTGTWYAGGTINGATVQLTINTGRGFFNGKTTVSSGDTNFTTVPEPGTLSLLGTGLIAVGGIVRRKLQMLRG